MHPPRHKGRANNPLASPMSAKLVLLARRLRSPKRRSEPPRASTKPRSYILPTRAVRCNLLQGAQHPSHSPELVRASVCTGKGNLRFHGRTSRE
jgi:hypothetical protein